MSDLNPEHHLVYAVQSLEQAEQVFWRNDPDPDTARFLLATAQTHAAIASAIAACHPRAEESA